MIRLRRRWLSTLFTVAATLAFAPAFSQSPPDSKSEVKWFIDRKLTVTAVAPAPPVLKYRLLPLAPDLRDGNAVPIYLRLVHEQNDAVAKALDRDAEALERIADRSHAAERSEGVPQRLHLPVRTI